MITVMRPRLKRRRSPSLRSVSITLMKITWYIIAANQVDDKDVKAIFD
jgi:hypothetical protein